MKSALKNMAAKSITLNINLSGKPDGDAKEAEELGLAPSTEASKKDVAPEAGELAGNPLVDGMKSDKPDGLMPEGDADLPDDGLPDELPEEED